MDGSRSVELASGFRALADPVRVTIVRSLAGGTRCACELQRAAGVSAPLLSHHLKVLRQAGLVSGQRRGRWVDYTLERDALRRLLGAIDVLEAVGAAT